MLGVFPVVVWSKPVMVDGKHVGWEARVEARTRDGSVVGAAEAECMVSERTWGSRDDYARRSMAQTRATSKAMRGPLGFVMTLAGFEATPAEEMPRDEPAERRQESTATPPKTWAQVNAIADGYGADLRWPEWVTEASAHLFNETDSKKLAKDQRGVILQKAAGAVFALSEAHDPSLFPGPDRAEVQRAWASVLQGHILDGPGGRALTLDDTLEDEVDSIADATLTGPGGS